MKKIHKKYCPDFKKLKIVFKSKLRNNNWVGDWDLKSNTIMINNKLSDIDKFGVIIHEFIEMMTTSMFGIPDCCQKKYSQEKHGKRNERAHNLANRIEKRILSLGGYSWLKHEERIVILKKKLLSKFETVYKLAKGIL